MVREGVKTLAESRGMQEVSRCIVNGSYHDSLVVMFPLTAKRTKWIGAIGRDPSTTNIQFCEYMMQVHSVWPTHGHEPIGGAHQSRIARQADRLVVAVTPEADAVQSVVGPLE